ncbi:phosphotransferase [Streptomyces sp. 2A115]|uniref:phosphotransferase n=1 Tax=Streptomyces sp. 2A115 TaxID=3457439 RepID=UPI003FD0F014
MKRGHHNLNYMVPLTEPMARRVGGVEGTLVTVRSRLPEVLPVVIRTWQDESEVLRAAKGVLPHVPECLDRRGNTAVHSYVEGVPLSSICPDDKPVDPLLIAALAGLLGEMTRVRKEALPPLPESWPRNGKDSTGFLRTLVQQAEQQIRVPNWRRFGGLFAALDVPEDALVRFAERLPVLARRPYSLLHTDLHRDNVIVSYHGQPPLICVDWELASYGDPLHDLATHLVRMRYPEFQREEVTDAWARVMNEIRPAALNGLDRDLETYLDFERAQSVFPDVMRAANSLGDTFDQQKLDKATQAVRRALVNAAAPLQLPGPPGESEIERALYRWWAAGSGPEPQRLRQVAPIRWEPDDRVPERADFPRSAVMDALVAEGAAPASRVFKGTMHLNTVVQVPGVDFPVVVRRKVRSAIRRERCLLDEHAVLKAIEESSGVPVHAPRALALGTSCLGDQFTIQSYEGPAAGEHPPKHPVKGLRPEEADVLVDQLVALTSVNYEGISGAVEQVDFYSWLSDELVRLVSELPVESLKLAREFGLPDAQRLGELLQRHRAVSRQPALLHGDLNPWNMVRRQGGGLALIDWEMAMVGDPLYDLVRHIHLTPTEAWIRDRMFERWTSKLPEESTRGWSSDRRLYRWIEIVRSAYVDLDRLVTGSGLDAPNVRRAVGSYEMTLAHATAALGLPPKTTINPYLARALRRGEHV